MDKEIIGSGVLISPPKPEDYILGAVNQVVSERKINDWEIYLPTAERQFSTKADFLDCVTMSGVDHSISTQLNYLMSQNLLPDEALYFFHKERYIQNGSFSLSSRFSAKINGTDKLKGNYLNAVADSARLVGFAAEATWPSTDDMSWDEFYKPIPFSLFDIAKKVLWWIDIKYQWINREDLIAAQSFAPVQCAIEVCPGYGTDQVVHRCSGISASHAVLNYKHTNNWLIFDHYGPFQKTLADDYEFPLSLQYLITVKPMTLRKGMYGSNVLQLQKDLSELGFILISDSDFGSKTEKMVIAFQDKMGLVLDGIAGPKTLGKIKELNTPKSLVDIIISVESNGNDNAIGDTNLPNHAYGALQIRQGVCDDVNSHFNTNFKAQDCLGNRSISLSIWEKYWKVYPLFYSDEEKARVWNGGPGWKKIYFKTNKTAAEIMYCKNLDIYWSKVKSLL